MSIFNKPYPKDSNPKRRLITSIVFGAFVFLFLSLFQPFGINMRHPQNKILVLMGYGLITSVAVLFNSFVMEKILWKWFQEEGWKVWKEILLSLWNLLFIGTLNLIYTVWIGLVVISFRIFLSFQGITLLVGIFPIVAIILLKYSRLQKMNQEGAQKLNNMIDEDAEMETKLLSINSISLMAENGKDQITINPEDLLLLVAADNYVEIYFLQNNQLKKELIRNSIRNLEESLKKQANFFRCHRSYLVNLGKVIHVSGNSQGYKLHLDSIELLVPVSRSLNEIIRKKISELHSIHPN